MDSIIFQVSLEEKRGYVTYDPGVTSASQVRDYIDDMGFEAALLDAPEPELRAISETCVVDIRGMTCGSCVLNIESTISERAGINTIKVRLLFLVRSDV